jgi:hypothetical protein
MNANDSPIPDTASFVHHDTDPTPPEWLEQALFDAIYSLRKRLGKELLPQQINDGYCREYAEEVLSHINDDHKVTVLSYKQKHTFLKYQGNYYDAERIQYGAREIGNLPMFNTPAVETPSEDSLIEGFPESEKTQI